MLIVDVEASGVVYDKHSIISIGALDYDNPNNRFYGECRIWEGAHIMEEATAIHGLGEAELTDKSKVSEAELVRAFMEWSQHLTDRTLTGQNVSFDRDMLKAACGRAGLPWDMAHRTIDTHTLCFMHMVKRGLVPPIDPQHRRSALNLDAVLNYCGIPAEPEPHNALTGAMCHAEVVARLLHDRMLLPEFADFPIPWSN
ncbi:MAG: 3'-5' exonuclease [Candidatus Paceibacterota bacterium]